MTIQLQFVAEAGVGATAIRWFTHSDFSHVDTVMPDGRLLGARSDTATPGVAIRSPDYAMFTTRKRVTVPTSDAAAAIFYAFLHAQLGKPYDMTAIYAFAVNRNWREVDSWFCSELVASALETAGIVKIVSQANRITPNDAFLLAASVSSSVY